MTKHSSIVGGSSAGRVIACPPSRLSAEGIPDQESEFAKRGTILHAAVEEWLRTGKAEAGRSLLIPGDEDMLEKFKRACVAWGELLDKYEFMSQSYSEIPVHLTPIPGAFGTIDILAQHRYMNAVMVLDWKFGDGVQVSPDSAQNHFYAAAAMHDRQTRWMFDAETKVHMVIVQPNSRGEPVIREHWTDVVALFDFTQKLEWAIENGHRDELLNSGEHCRFCPVNPVCPRLKADAEGALAWEDPHKLEPAELAEALDLVNRLDTWSKKVREYAYDRLNHDREVPGYKLVAKRARREWTDEEKVLAWAKDEGITMSQLYESKLASVAQLSRLVSEVPEHLYEKKSSGTTVVAEADPRPAVKSAKALAHFATQLSLLKLRQKPAESETETEKGKDECPNPEK